MPVTSEQMTLETWIEAFPHKEVEAEIERLTAERDAIDAKIERRKAALELYRQSGAEKRPIPQVASGPPVVENGRPTMRQAVLAVMGTKGRHKWYVRDLRKALVARDWLRDDPQADRALQNMLLIMLKAGQLERPAYSQYRLPKTAEGNGQVM
jgi:hypothetical protein